MSILVTSSCKKDEVAASEEQEEETVIPDYRDSYLGDYTIDYRFIAFEITNPAGADTIYESFVGQFVTLWDSLITLLGASWGDLKYKVLLSGELIMCGGIDAGVIYANSVVTDYTVNGFTCPTQPNGWIQKFKFTGVR